MRYMEEKMSVSGIAKIFKEWGQSLVKKEPVAAYELISRTIDGLALKRNLN